MTFFGPVAAAVLSISLLVAGVAHLSAPGVLRKTLEDHAVVPRRVAGRLAVLVSVTETATGAAMSGLWLTGASVRSSPWLQAATAVALILLVAYSLYLVLLTRRRPGTACGCGLGIDDVSVSGWHLFRNGLLCASAPLSYADPRTGSVSPEEAGLMVLAVGSFLAIVFHIPASMARPSPPHRGLDRANRDSGLRRSVFFDGARAR